MVRRARIADPGIRQRYLDRDAEVDRELRKFGPDVEEPMGNSKVIKNGKSSKSNKI